MAESNTFSRTIHDLGLAAWFGGSLMGAIGLNGGAAEAANPSERSRVANAGWAKWTPVNLVAIVAHLIGGAGLLAANRKRVAGQAGVAQATNLKLVLTAAALGATAYGRMVGQKQMDAGPQPVEGVTEPGAGTSGELAKAQKQQKQLQWLIPALTAGILVVNSRLGEQQRPAEVAHGILHRLNPAA